MAVRRREAELAADRLGARLACQAGYDVAKGAAVYRFMSKSRAHPEREVRRAAVLAVGCGKRYSWDPVTTSALPLLYLKESDAACYSAFAREPLPARSFHDEA